MEVRLPRHEVIVSPAREQPELVRTTARVADCEDRQTQSASLGSDKKKLSTEREILRSAAKYFAGERNW